MKLLNKYAKTRSSLHLKHYKGLSLIEVITASTILSIAIIGGISYRYYSALDGRMANIHSSAARVALLLCESWDGEGGNTGYDPVSHLTSDNFVISAGNGPAVPSGFTLLGKYEIQYNGIKYYATLSWKDVQPTLRALSVVVAWSHRDKAENNLADMDRLFELTTYITN